MRKGRWGIICVMILVFGLGIIAGYRGEAREAYPTASEVDRYDATAGSTLDEAMADKGMKHELYQQEVLVYLKEIRDLLMQIRDQKD